MRGGRGPTRPPPSEPQAEVIWHLGYPVTGQRPEGGRPAQTDAGRAVGRASSTDADPIMAVQDSSYIL